MPEQFSVPANMQDFAQQARSFVEKARAAGKSNTAIANTIQFMYQMAQMNAQAQGSQKPDYEYYEYRDINGDGIVELVDRRTGDIIKDMSSSGNTSDFDKEFYGMGAGSSQYSDNSTTNVTNVPQTPTSATSAATDYTKNGVMISPNVPKEENKQDNGSGMNFPTLPDLYGMDLSKLNNLQPEQKQKSVLSFDQPSPTTLTFN